MGHQGDFGHPGDVLQNGYLSSEETRVTSLSESERWMVAEERTTALMAGVQPNPESEKLRNAVVDYVQRLITKCFPCEVFAFGSVPLKTYLPDGDIDLTTFSTDQNLKDKWAKELCTMLKNEEKSDTAEFCVKQIQYIQAEVKIVKCLVENIVVDISFNQLGGLCTLCFLEEIDHKISQNHLFKRSIILIKAWCYYESRILGAHHGLISTYALEILVLYVFHIHNNSFAGPLEVLYRFLEFFSKFDWDNFCISLWGPIPINALPDMTVESPIDDTEELRLDKLFLSNLTSVYVVDQNGQDNQEHSFLSKYLNIVDPLRTNNNLGRSVCKGNFYRIQSAFAYGAKTLVRLLECPRKDLIYEFNQFFINTWDRHESGRSPDATSYDILRPQPLHMNPEDMFGNVDRIMMNRNTSKYDIEAEDTHSYPNTSSENGTHPSESISRNSNISELPTEKNYVNQVSPMISDQIAAHSSFSNETLLTEKVQSSRPYLINEGQGRFRFARTSSSPELSETSFNVILSQGSRGKMPEVAKSEIVASRTDHNENREEISGSEVAGSDSTRSSTEDPLSWRLTSSHQILEDATNSNNASNSLHDEAGLRGMGEDPDEVIGPENETSSRDEVFAESSLDGSSMKFPKSSGNNEGNETSPSLVHSTVDGKGKTGSQYEVSLLDHGSSQAHDESQELVTLSTIETDKRSIQSASNKVSSYDTEQISGSASILSSNPIYVGSGSRQRTVGYSGVESSALYPSGPPVPFSAMLQVHNVPTEWGNSEGFRSPFYGEERQDSNSVKPSDQNFNSAGILDQPYNFGSSQAIQVVDWLDFSDENKSDIFRSDFVSHWQNLQYGRYCQEQLYHGGRPLTYPSPIEVPPVYLQEQFPWDNPGRPPSGNVNPLTQLMGYTPPVVPLPPLQPGISGATAAYQHYGDEAPKHRGGTGTYLPSPRSRDRPSSGARNRRGNQGYDWCGRNGDKEGNWKVIPRPQPGGQSYSNSFSDKPSSKSDSSDKPWNSYTHESVESYQAQAGSFGSSSPAQNSSTHTLYGTNQLPMDSSYVLTTGSGVPSDVMLYSYNDHNVGTGSPSDQLEFGSVPAHFPRMNEVSHLGEGVDTRDVYEPQRFRGDSPTHSSLHRPSSLQLQRPSSQMNYQLKDEDFPPLSFPYQGCNGGVGGGSAGGGSTGGRGSRGVGGGNAGDGDGNTGGAGGDN